MTEPTDPQEKPLAQPPPPKAAHIKRPPPRVGAASAPAPPGPQPEIVLATLVSDPSAAMPAVKPPPISAPATAPRSLAQAATGLHPIWYALTGFLVISMLGLLFFVIRRQTHESQILVEAAPSGPIAPPSPRSAETETSRVAEKQVNLKPPADPPPPIRAASPPAPPVPAVPKVDVDLKRRDDATTLLEVRQLKRVGRTWVLNDENQCLNLLDTSKQAEKRVSAARTAESMASKKVDSLRRMVDREESQLKRLGNNRASTTRDSIRQQLVDRIANNRKSLKAAEDEAKTAKKNLDAATKRMNDTLAEAKRLAEAMRAQYQQLTSDKQVQDCLIVLGHQLGPSEEFNGVRATLGLNPR